MTPEPRLQQKQSGLNQNESYMLLLISFCESRIHSHHVTQSNHQRWYEYCHGLFFLLIYSPWRGQAGELFLKFMPMDAVISVFMTLFFRTYCALKQMLDRFHFFDNFVPVLSPGRDNRSHLKFGDDSNAITNSSVKLASLSLIPIGVELGKLHS